jgi:hypothetical protein
MLELYFIFYRVPKTMTRLARERNRSALAWSLIGIGVWVGAELLVGFTIGVFYAVGIEFWGWPENSAPNAIAYLAGLVAALVSVHIVTRILTNMPREKTFASPPPPPQFHNSETEHEVAQTNSR